MILILQNQTGNIKTYASGAVTLPANGTVTVAITNQLATATDGNLFADIGALNTTISDGVNSFKVTDAYDYLNRLVASFTNLNDGAGNPIGSYNSQFAVVDALLNTTGIQAAITVGTSAVLACTNGSSNLANRKCLTVYNNGTAIIYWGYTNGVTTSTGTPILIGQLAVWDATSATSIYLISGTANQNTRITEGG